jgi:hypothetical protein
MAGRMQAMLVAAASAILSLLMPPITAPFTYVGSAAVMLVTLRRGPQEGLLVLAGAALATALLARLAVGQPVAVVVAMLLLWLPGWLVAWVLRRTVSLARALQSAAAIGGVSILAVYALLGDPAPQWKELLQALLGTALEQGAMELEPGQMDRLLNEAARMMTGTMAAALVLGLIVSLLLARWWQSLLYNPGGFRQEFHPLALPPLMAWLTLGLLLGARLTEGLAASLSLQLGLVAIVPYLFVGLAVLHGLAAKAGTRPGWLVALYVVLLLVPQAAVVLVVLGLLDTWGRFRTRLGGPRGQGPGTDA